MGVYEVATVFFNEFNPSMTSPLLARMDGVGRLLEKDFAFAGMVAVALFSAIILSTAAHRLVPHIEVMLRSCALASGVMVFVIFVVGVYLNFAHDVILVASIFFLLFGALSKWRANRSQQES